MVWSRHLDRMRENTNEEESMNEESVSGTIGVTATHDREAALWEAWGGEEQWRINRVVLILPEATPLSHPFIPGTIR